MTTGDDPHLVQRALSRTFTDRYERGVPDYPAMSDTELLAAVDDTKNQSMLPMWEMVLELSRRFRDNHRGGVTIPRSLPEIIQDAERLAAAAEAFEPTDDQLAYSGELARLHRAARAQVAAQTEVLDAVVAARAAGAPWREIANLLSSAR